MGTTTESNLLAAQALVKRRCTKSRVVFSMIRILCRLAMNSREGTLVLLGQPRIVRTRITTSFRNNNQKKTNKQLSSFGCVSTKTKMFPFYFSSNITQQQISLHENHIKSSLI